MDTARARSTEAAAPTKTNERVIYVVEGNLLHQPVEIIVNSWHRNILPSWLLLSRQSIATEIGIAAGREPFKELAEHGSLPLGGAVLTGAGRLKKKGIIHVAGVNLLGWATEKSVRQSAESAMEIVNRLHFRSVAFPVIGVESMKEQRAYEILTDALMKIPSVAEVRIVRRSLPAKNCRRR